MNRLILLVFNEFLLQYDGLPKSHREELIIRLAKSRL